MLCPYSLRWVVINQDTLGVELSEVVSMNTKPQAVHCSSCRLWVQDRKKCVTTAIDALCSVRPASFCTTFSCAAALPLRRTCQGQKVVIDRCNVTRLQRRVWLGVADENQAACAMQRRRRGATATAKTRQPPGQCGLHLVRCARGRVELRTLGSRRAALNP